MTVVIVANGNSLRTARQLRRQEGYFSLSGGCQAKTIIPDVTLLRKHAYALCMTGPTVCFYLRFGLRPAGLVESR